MVTKMQKEVMIKEWGSKTCDEILEKAELYSKKWGLTALSLVEHYSMNAIFCCESRRYGSCVLKIGGGISDADFILEYRVLSEYAGKAYVKLYDSDVDDGRNVMLLERILPGTMLRAEPDGEGRLNAFISLFIGLHLKPSDPVGFPKYGSSFEMHIEALSKQEKRGDLLAHVLRARDIFNTVSMEYNREMLLHGDMHSGNILKKETGEYVIIDPQGSIGDPVFDTSRFIMMEHYNNKDMQEREHRDFLNHIIGSMEQRLNIPNEIIRQCFYVETILFECWWASLGDYDIANSDFAQQMMNS